MLAPALVLLLSTGLQTPVEASAKVESPIEAAPRDADADEPPIDPAVHVAAARGLAWLAAHQAPRGSWGGDVGHKRGDDYLILRHAETNEREGQGHIGVTALCGMAFLAGGHLPGRGEYGEVVQRTIDYVLAHVQENGLITDGGTRMYSHAFATLFLAEVYGMTADEGIRTGLERAVQIIVDCQNHQGGWRYNAFTTEADLSVTVCQLQALRAARNIGIRVPKQTIDDAVAFVKRARTPYGRSKGLFYYKNEGRSARMKNREYAINAAASTALYSAGVRDEDLHAPVLDFLTDEYPQLLQWYPTHFYYWYGNYYACQAFFQAGGERWIHFERRILTDLLRLQRSDGRWVNDTGPGDAFSTAVATVILEIPNQYLPIFQR